MHAKVVSVEDVKTLWGIDVDGGEIGVFTFDNTDSAGGFGYTATVPRFVSEKKDNSVLVIEKYSKPTSEYPKGRLIIVAGDTLVFDGDLPFVNGEEGTRTYPFAKQHCLDNLGSFFGSSVVERIIPVQRAYNTVKNRKHEFMNRIAMGVLAVEDGSVDTDNLEGYQRDYLAGFSAERNDTSLDDGLVTAKQSMDATIKREALSCYHYDVVGSYNADTTYSDIGFHYSLVPIWMFGCKHKDKMYRYIVNGRTGRSYGKYPISAGKVCSIVFAVLAFIAAVVAIIYTQGM